LREDADYLNDLLRQFEALIHKTMNRLNISQNNMFYDDYTQELKLQLIDIYHSFTGNPLEVDVDRYKFTAYAGQGLYWHGLNLLRKNNRLDTFYPTDEETMDWLQGQESDSGQNFETSLYIEDFLQQAKARLTAEDYRLLLYLVEGQQTMKALAKRMGVSRDTIYQRRKRIQTRLHDLKDCLMH